MNSKQENWATFEMLNLLVLVILFYKSQVLNYFNWILNHLYLVFKVLLRKNKCFHFSEINNEAEDSNYFY